MAIKAYEPNITKPEVHKYLSKLTERALSTRGLLTALGDFWTTYYANVEGLAQALSGHGAMVSKAYTKLLDNVLNASINTVREVNATQFELCSIDVSNLIPKNAAGTTVAWNSATVDYYLYETPGAAVVDCPFLCSSLFEANVILEQGVHYDIVRGEGFRFYVDLRNDKAISDYCYTLYESTDDTTTYLFWACDLALSSNVIYDRYGVFLYKKAEDCQAYHQLILSLMRFYTNAKTAENLRVVIDTLYGIPYARYASETVKRVCFADADLNLYDKLEEPAFRAIVTDKSTYYTYSIAEPTVHAGDVIPQFTQLASLNQVYDYINKPGWWESVDPGIIQGVTVTEDQKNRFFETILKYNTIYVSVAITYDTYKQYKEIMATIMKLVRTGVPCYISPTVEAVVRDAIVDPVDFTDLREDITNDKYYLHAVWQSKVTNITYTYNGDVPYFMETPYLHGWYCKYVDKTYNGMEDYNANPLDSTQLHNGFANECYTYNGVVPYGAYDYAKYKHQGGSDFFEITGLRTNLSDTYDMQYSAVPDLVEPLYYNGLAIHNSEYNYGTSGFGYTNDLFTFTYKVAPEMTDYVDRVKDEFVISRDYAPINFTDSVGLYEDAFVFGKTVTEGYDFSDDMKIAEDVSITLQRTKKETLTDSLPVYVIGEDFTLDNGSTLYQDYKDFTDNPTEFVIIDVSGACEKDSELLIDSDFTLSKEKLKKEYPVDEAVDALTAEDKSFTFSVKHKDN